MDGMSMTPEQEKLDALRKVIPEAFSEGKVDYEKLQATLGEDINFANERYVLNWAGKSDAFRILQIPTTKTLIPAKDESVNFDDTEHIFIEGENLEVLKVLQRSYFGKVKMIYIDPPYNTGNDSFIYPDKFAESKANYEKRVGDKDEEGYMTKDGMFRKNSKENGQYHSNWLNMMMPRLYLAKNLLRQDGVIFVSIDDNEVHNLRLLMNEIFGEENFVGSFCIRSTPNARDYGHIGKMHENCLFYVKNINETVTYHLPDKDKIFKYVDDISAFNIHPLYNSNESFHKENRANLYYPFYLYLAEGRDEDGFFKIGLEKKKNAIEVFPPFSNKNSVQFVWRWGVEKSQKNINKEIVGYQTGGGEYRIVQKMRTASKVIRSILDSKPISNRRGTAEVEELFNKKIFSFPKPVALTKYFVQCSTKGNDLILDFFAGSATAAHAVMTLNTEDGGNRKCISVQLPELCDEKSEAHKAGYKTIADIAKERIRRAGKKIQGEIKSEINNAESKIKQLHSELPTEETDAEIENLNVKIKQLKNQDLGFKVLKLSNSNFKQWQPIEGKGAISTRAERAKMLAKQMKLSIDPVAENATTENMIYELLLKSGKDLNSTVEQQPGYTDINNGELMLLLEKVNQKIINTVIAAKPQKVIALDNLFKSNDQLKTNIVLQMKDAGIEFKTI